jgi:surfeit locus 1 family protein
LRPAVVPTIAAIAGVTLFISAGLWQRDRMEQKLAMRAQLDAATRSAPVPMPQASDWSAWRYRPVIAAGSFDSAHQILLDNRIQQGRAGYHVVTPLVLADGRVVLVVRGWVAASATRADVPSVPPPAGPVSVAGRINMPPGAYLELASDTRRGKVWQNLDLSRYASATGLAVLPVIVEQTSPIDRDDTLVREWPTPDLGVEKHRIYMLQWFAFAALAAGLWLYFALRRKP